MYPQKRVKQSRRVGVKQNTRYVRNEEKSVMCGRVVCIRGGPAPHPVPICKSRSPAESVPSSESQLPVHCQSTASPLPVHRQSTTASSLPSSLPSPNSRVPLPGSGVIERNDTATRRHGDTATAPRPSHLAPARGHQNCVRSGCSPSRCRNTTMLDVVVENWRASAGMRAGWDTEDDSECAGAGVDADARNQRDAAKGSEWYSHGQNPARARAKAGSTATANAKAKANTKTRAAAKTRFKVKTTAAAKSEPKPNPSRRPSQTRQEKENFRPCRRCLLARPHARCARRARSPHSPRCPQTPRPA